MAAVGDGDEVFILRERSDGGGEGEVGIKGDGGETAFEVLTACADMRCRRDRKSVV